MRIPRWLTNNLTWPWGWVAAAIASIAVCALVIWLITWPARTAQHAADATAGQVFGQAQTEAAHDAIAIQDAALNAATRSETLTRETADAIHHAPGADQRLDPDLNRTGRERLCLREAYRRQPQCLQQPGGPVPAR